MINSNVSSFQAGVNTLYNKCVNCGVTPSAKTPAAISTSIQSIYTNRYNTGYNAGKTAVPNFAFTNKTLTLYKTGSGVYINSNIIYIWRSGTHVSCSINVTNFSGLHVILASNACLLNSIIYGCSSMGATTGTQLFSVAANVNNNRRTESYMDISKYNYITLYNPTYDGSSNFDGQIVVYELIDLY